MSLVAMPVYPMDGDGYSTEESLPDELNLEDELQPHRTSQLDEHGRAVMIALTELVRHIESTGADDELDLLTHPHVQTKVGGAHRRAMFDAIMEGGPARKKVRAQLLNVVAGTVPFSPSGAQKESGAGLQA